MEENTKNIFEKYINVLSEIKKELEKLGFSIKHMEEFKNDISGNLQIVKNYETYLIDILDEQRKLMKEKINRIASEIKTIKEDENETQPVLDSVKSDESLINLNEQLEIIQNIYLKYTKGKTSVYLNFNYDINLDKYIDYIFKTNIILEDSSVFVKSDKNDIGEKFENFKISKNNKSLNTSDTEVISNKKEFQTLFEWENIKNKATFLFSINILGIFDIKTFLDNLFNNYSEIEIKNVIENYFDKSSDFITLSEKGDTVTFVGEKIKGKQNSINELKNVSLTKDTYKNIFDKVKKEKIEKPTRNIFYEFEINKDNETATIILCNTAKLQSPTELSKSFYTDAKDITRPFISDATSSRDIKIDKFKDKFKKDRYNKDTKFKEFETQYKDKDKQTYNKFISKLADIVVDIQTNVKEQIFLRESIKQIVKYLSKEDKTLSTMKDLLLKNYENNFNETITEKDTTEITNIIKQLSNNKPCNFYVFSSIEFNVNNLVRKDKDSDSDILYTEKIKNMLELLDNIERT